MAISANVRDMLINIYVGMFKAAPGLTDLNQMVADYEAGMTQKQIAAKLALTPAFVAEYPTSQTPQEFANELVDFLCGPGFADRAWAVNWVLTRVNSGVPKSEVIVMAVNGIVASDNPVYASVRALVANRLEVSKYWAITQEENGSVELRQDFLDGVNSTAGSVTAAKAEIDAYLAPPVLSVDSPSVVEGNAGTKSLIFTLTLDKASDAPLSINYQTLNTGTASSASDFNAAAGVVTFAAGQTSATVSIVVTGDTDVEANETVRVQFSSSGIAATVVGTGTILNDDALVNQAPVARAAAASAVEDGAVLSGNLATDGVATDVDSATLTFALVTGAAGFTLAPNGAWTFNPGNAAYQGLKVGQTTNVVVTYQVSDGALSASNSVTFTVTGTNDGPIASNLSVSGNEDNAINGSVAAVDPEGEAVNYVLVAGPTKGALVFNPNGTYTYTPNANTNGVDSFTYQAVDASSGLSNVATVTLNLAAVNDAPVAGAAAVGATEDGAVLSGNLATGGVATDVDSTTLTFALVSGAPGFSLASNGDWTFNPGNAAYQSLKAGQTTNVAITYQVSDGALSASNTVTFTVTGVNDLPVVTDITVSGTENVVVTGQVAGTDVDGDTLTFSASNVQNGTLVLNAQTGAYTFTPAANFFGVASFNYVASDSQGSSNTGTVTINVGDAVNVLTPALDNIPLPNAGSAELVVGTNNNLNAGDIIVGGAEDTLFLSIDQSLALNNFASFQLNGVGTFKVTNDDNAPVNFDMSSSSGVDHVQTFNSTQAISFNQVTNNVTLDVINLTTAATSDVTVQYQDTVVAGAADEMDVNLINSDADDITIGRVGDNDGGIETINLDVQVRGSTVDHLDTDMTNLNITGGNNLTINTALNPTIRNVDASTIGGAFVSLSVAGATGGVTINTADGSDTIVGSSNSDTINVGEGNNNVNGGPGAGDTITAGDGNNTILTAGTGADSITVGDGNNLINTFFIHNNANDTVSAGNGNNTINSSQGNDQISFGDGNNVVTTDGGNDNVVGGDGANNVNAGSGNDSVVLGDGGNVVDAGSGNDYVATGSGNDLITTGTGLDTVYAGGGNDTIVSGSSFDASWSGLIGTEQDIIDGGAGTDELRLNGSSGRTDTNFRLASSIEVLTLTDAGTTQLGGNNQAFPAGANYAETAGIHTINMDFGYNGNDNVDASTFSRDLTVNIGAGNDNVRTGSGSDTFNIAQFDNNDTLNAGAGHDVLNLDADTSLNSATAFTGFEVLNLGSERNGSASGDVVDHDYNITLHNGNTPNPNSANTGILTINGSELAADDDGIGQNADETLILNASAVNTYRVSVLGGAAGDTITSGQLNDTINSGAGNDQIILVSGNNVVDAGSGADSITIGTGNDNVQAGSGNDTFVINTVNFSSADTLDGGADTDTISMTGNSSDVQYTNTSSVEVLTSVTDGSTHTLAAQAQEAGIRTVNLANDGVDPGTAGSTLAASAYTVGGNLTVNGGNGDDSITTGEGDDSIIAGDGNDVISTNGGNDTVILGNGDENINLGSGNDMVVTMGSQLTFAETINGGSGTDTIRLNNSAGGVNVQIDLDTVTNVERYDFSMNGDWTILADADASSITFRDGAINTLTNIVVDASIVTDTLDSLTVTWQNTVDVDFTFNVTGTSGSDLFVKQFGGFNNNINIQAGDGADVLRINGGDMGANIVFNGGNGFDSIQQTGGNISDDDFVGVSNTERLMSFGGVAVVAQLGGEADRAGIIQIDTDSNGSSVLLDPNFDNTLTINLGNGTDAVNGSNSVATLNFWANVGSITAADVLMGGMTANDTMNLYADSSNTNNLVNVNGIERFNIVEVTDNSATLNFANSTFTNVASGVITVDASGLNDLGIDLPEGSLTLNAGGITAGAFVVYGGTGADAIYTGSGNDVIDLNEGNDVVDSGAGNDTITNNGGNNHVTAGAGHDSVTLSDGNNTVYGGSGNDAIIAGDGNNIVDGGADNDTITLGSGNNTVNGGTGADTIMAGHGDNTVNAGDGKDVVTVGNGDNTVTGGGGGDAINLGSGQNIVRFVKVSDSSGLLAGRDTVSGFDGDDVLWIETNVLKAGVTSINYIGDAVDPQDADLGISMTANDGVADAVYDVSTGRLMIDVNDDGLLTGLDLAIEMPDVGPGMFGDINFAVVDTIKPDAPTLDLLHTGFGPFDSTDGGISQVDNLTNDPTVLVRVDFNNTSDDGTQAEAGNTLTLTNANGPDYVRVLTAGDIANGFYTFLVNMPNPGANNFSAVISDGVQSSDAGLLTIQLDTTAPTLSVSDNEASLEVANTGWPYYTPIYDFNIGTADDILNIAEGSITFTLQFSENVFGLSVGDLVVTGGSIVGGSFTVVDSNTYTVRVTPDANFEGSISVDLTNDWFGNPSVFDHAGNQLANPAAYTQQVDTLRPTLTITDDEVDNVVNIADGTVTYTFQFSEAVQGFTASDITLTNGMVVDANDFVMVDADTYTLKVTPTANTEGNLTVSVGAGTYLDMAENYNTDTDVSSQTLDTLKPSIFIAQPIAGDGIINAAEDNTIVIAGSTIGAVGQTVNVSITDGVTTVTGTAVVQGDGTWSSTTMNVSALNNGNLTVTAQVNDAAGNPSLVASAVVALDNVNPNVVSITDDQAGTVNDADMTVKYTVTFGEPMQGFTAGDLTVTGGTVSNFVALAGGTTYTFDVTAPDNSTTPINVSIAAGVATDNAGNPNNPGAAAAQAVDTVNPTVVTITDDQAGIANIADTTVVYTVTFSETVANFVAGDLVVTGGTVSGFSGAGNVYTFTVTAPLGSTTPIEVSVPAGSLTDSVGNLLLVGANAAAQAVDTVAPTLTITDDQAGVANDADPIVGYTVTFSEAVTGFTSGDVVVTGGTLSSFAGSGTTYTFNVTAAGDSTADITVNVAAGVAFDLANNGNVAGSAANQPVDTYNPRVIAEVDDRPGITNGAVTYTLTFNEAVSGLTSGDFTVANGQVTYLEQLSASQYLLVVAPDENEDGADLDIDLLAGAVVDVNGNSSFAYAFNVQPYDTVAPNIPGAPVLSTSAHAPAEDSDSGVEGDNITNDNTPTLRATAAVGSKITFFADLDNDDVMDAGEFLATTAPVTGVFGTATSTVVLADGTYNIKAYATDPADNDSAPSTATAITIDTTPPNAPALDLLAASDSGVSNTDNLTNIDPVTIRVSLAGTNAVAGDTLTLSDDGVLQSQVLTLGDIGAGWVDVAVDLEEGANSLTAYITDIAANVGATSAALVVTLDTIAPNAPSLDLLASSDSGASDSDNLTNIDPSTVRVSLGGTNAVAGDTLTLSDDGVLQSVVLTAGNIGTGWVDVAVDLEEGVNSLTAYITDMAANVGATSAALPVTLDTTAPTVVSIVVSDPIISEADAGGPAFTVTVTYNEAMDPGINPSIGFNADVVASGTLTFGGGVWSAGNTVYTASYTVADVNEEIEINPVDISVIGADDAAGNDQVAGSSINAFVVDTIAPIVTVADFDGVDGYLNDAEDNSVTISGTASLDTAGQVISFTVTDTLANTVVGNTIVNGDGTWGATLLGLDTLAQGLLTVTTSVVDNVGNPNVGTLGVTTTIHDSIIPTVGIAVSDVLISEADAGGNFTVTLTFSEVMNNTVAPVINFTNPAISGTLTFSSGVWSAGDTVYTATYLVSDDNVTQADLDVEVSGAQDLAANPIALTTSANAFDIDTVAPTVVSIVANDSMITDANVGAGNFSVAITFSEAMDTGTAPVVAFANPAVDGTLINPNGVWSGGNTVYTVTYDVVDTNVEISNLDVDVSGAKDAALNDLVGTITEVDEFSIDTLNPTASSITVSDTLINEADAGGTFDVVVTFSEAMNTGVAPVITFISPAIVSTLAFSAGVWSAGNTVYTATYNVTDDNVELDDLDVQVTTAQDVNGNVMTAATEVDAFDIDTIAPVATFTHAVYNNVSNTLVINGTGFIGADATPVLASEELLWDIDSDNAGVDPNYTFPVLASLASSLVTDTTITVELSTTDGAALEGSVSFMGNVQDGLDISAGLLTDDAMNPSTVTADNLPFLYNFTGTANPENIFGSNYTLPLTVLGDTLNGGLGADTITGLAGDDIINGGDGADVIYGGLDQDTMSGGDQDDIFIVDGVHAANPGYDAIASAILGYTTTLSGLGDVDAVFTETVFGGAGNDTVHLFGAVAGLTLNSVETVVLHSTWTFTSAQLLDGAFAELILDGNTTHTIIISDMTSANALTAFQTWLDLSGKQLSVTNLGASSGLTITGGLGGASTSFVGEAALNAWVAPYTDEGDVAGDDDVVVPPAGNFDVGANSQTLDASTDGSFVVEFYGTFATTDRTGNVINNFRAGSGFDVLDFSNLGLVGMERGNSGTDGGAFSGSVSAFNWQSTNYDDSNVNITGKVVLVDTDDSNDGNTAAEIFSMFNDIDGGGPTSSRSDGDAFSLDANGTAVIISGGDNGNNTLYIWVIQNDGTAAVAQSEISLVGTITPTASGHIDEFHASNFIF